MAGHEIIVLGTSAGGLKALTAIVKELPADLEAAVFVVQHLHANRNSLLPAILQDVGTLPAHAAQDGEAIRTGRIYVAVPDHHLLVSRGRVRVVRGPQENRFRPSIDALFRSAARSYGPRVIGVVLTGALDDGTIGLQAVKARGGITVVQDPAEAEYPSMPRSAFRFAKPDHVLSLSQIPDFLVRMSREPVPDESRSGLSRDLEIEARIAEQELQGKSLLESIDSIGTRTPFTCPECHGTLWQIGASEPFRFRCHTGHGFTTEALLTGQDDELEAALWSAVRSMEEKANLYRQLAVRGSPGEGSAIEYQGFADRLDAEVMKIKQFLLRGASTKRPPRADEDGTAEPAALLAQQGHGG